MRSFGSSITAFVIIGFFGITTLSVPFPRNHPTKPPSQPPPPSPPPPTTPTGSASGSTSSSVSSTGSGGETITVSAGTGTPGQVTVVNKCGFVVNLEICIQNPASCSGTSTIPANGGVHSEPYAPASEKGNSWKLYPITGSIKDILQFEYTNGGDGSVSYDLSEYNGNPFGTWGFSLTNTTTDVFCGPPATSLACPTLFTTATNGDPYTAPTSDGIGAILCG